MSHPWLVFRLHFVQFLNNCMYIYMYIALFFVSLVQIHVFVHLSCTYNYAICSFEYECAVYVYTGTVYMCPPTILYMYYNTYAWSWRWWVQTLLRTTRLMISCLAALSPPAAASGEPRLGIPAPPPCMLHNYIP